MILEYAENKQGGKMDRNWQESVLDRQAFLLEVGVGSRPEDWEVSFQQVKSQENWFNQKK